MTSIEVDWASSVNYVQQLTPRPAPGTLSIDYRALAKWIRLTDNGAGQLKFNSWGGWTPDHVPTAGVGTPLRQLGNCNPSNGAVDPLCGSPNIVKVMGGFTADTEQTTTKRDGAMAVQFLHQYLASDGEGWASGVR